MFPQSGLVFWSTRNLSRRMAPRELASHLSPPRRPRSPTPLPTLLGFPSADCRSHRKEFLTRWSAAKTGGGGDRRLSQIRTPLRRDEEPPGTDPCGSGGFHSPRLPGVWRAVRGGERRQEGGGRRMIREPGADLVFRGARLAGEGRLGGIGVSAGRTGGV